LISVPAKGGLRIGDREETTLEDLASFIKTAVQKYGSGIGLRIRAEPNTSYQQIRPIIQIAFENKLYLMMDMRVPSSGGWSVGIQGPKTMPDPKPGQRVFHVRFGHGRQALDGKPFGMKEIRDVLIQVSDIDHDCPVVLEVESDATCQDIANVLGLCEAVGLRQIYLQDALPHNSTSPSAPTTK
jgi:biopolymer transport protein ExbD